MSVSFRVCENSTQFRKYLKGKLGGFIMSLRTLFLHCDIYLVPLCEDSDEKQATHSGKWLNVSNL